MGTDIHAAIEYRDSDGQWVALKHENEYFVKWDDEPKMTAKLRLDRDYDVFAILAGVRNGTAFAGRLTGSGFDPMTNERGLPDDISKDALKEGCDGEHSATFVSLREILNYNWQRTVTKYGVVDAKEFENWDRCREWQPKPSRYSGDVFGPHIKYVSEEQMRTYVKSVIGETRGVEWDSAIKSLDENLRTRISWVESYAYAGRQIWEKILPIMLNASRGKYGFDGVRIVMNFDS